MDKKIAEEMIELAIKQLDFSNRTVENQFRADLKAMYELYDIGGDA